MHLAFYFNGFNVYSNVIRCFQSRTVMLIDTHFISLKTWNFIDFHKSLISLLFEFHFGKKKPWLIPMPHSKCNNAYIDKNALATVAMALNTDIHFKLLLLISFSFILFCVVILCTEKFSSENWIKIQFFICYKITASIWYARFAQKSIHFMLKHWRRRRKRKK